MASHPSHHDQPSLQLAGASFFESQDAEVLSARAIESRGDHTAARFFEKNQQAYRAVMIMYAKLGIGQLRIADTLKISIHTVRAVLEREKLSRCAAMDTAKTLETLSDIREMTLETLIAKLADSDERKKIPFDKLMIGIGIQTEKIELLRGNATERIEHVDSNPAADEFQRWLQEGSIEVQAIETSIRGEDDGQKGNRAVDGQREPLTAVPALPAHASPMTDNGDEKGEVRNMKYVGLMDEKANDSSVSKMDDVSPDAFQGDGRAMLEALRMGEERAGESSVCGSGQHEGDTQGGRGSLPLEPTIGGDENV